MDLLLFLLLLALAAGFVARARQQQRRIALLAGLLAPYDIEKLIEAVTQGYLRALGEPDPHRQQQVWDVLRGQEDALCRQVGQFAGAVQALDDAQARISRLPVWTPLTLGAGNSFSLRDALAVHARGICAAVRADAGTPARDRAFAISAELLLMQHTCHWFCRSKTVASARMQARHQTRYAQVLAAVGTGTRADYLRLVSPRSAG